MGTVSSAISPWAETLTVTAPEARLALSAVFAKSAASSVATEGGVVEGANPSVSVSGNNLVVTAHQMVVEDSNGTWICTSAASLTCPIDTPLPASGTSRYDLVVGEVVSGVYRLRSIAGTAAASPSVPSVPANVTPLFRLLVTNSGPQTPTVIYWYTRAPGGIRLVEDTTDTRAGGFVGDLRKTRLGIVQRWTGSGWETIASPIAWTQFSPTLYYAGTSHAASGGTGPPGTVNLGTDGTALRIGRYNLIGKKLDLNYHFKWADTTTGTDGGSGGLYTTLPAGLLSRAAAEQHIHAKLFTWPYPHSGPSNSWPANCYIPPNSDRMWIEAASGPTDPRLWWHRVAKDVGVNGASVPLVPGSLAQGGTINISGTIEVQ